MSAVLRTPIDLLVHSTGELCTPLGTTPRSGSALGEVQRLAGGAVAVDSGRIVAVGSRQDLERRFEARAELDGEGGLVLPGLVDAHTHPVFAAGREDEFELRTRGKTYVEIAAAGGGILSSVRGVRGASKEQLLKLLERRLERFLDLGTTTIEAKSGYGLSLEAELKSLEVLRAARERGAVDIAPTFLGAHEFPEEYRTRRSAYVELLLEEWLPRVAESRLAEFADVFTEQHVFDLEASRRLMERARSLGLRLRMHVDQLSALGGAELAARLRVDSADHLEFVSDAGIAALAEAGVVAVLCPLVPLYLRIEHEAPARRMIDAGVPIAISTDFNPGSCPMQSLPQVMTWAALRYRMSADECLTAATLNPACSLGRGAEIGTLEAGKRADVVIFSCSSLRQLVAEFGASPVRAVIVRGRVVRGAARSRTLTPRS
ncbi:MAG TPA: imidazolonepropionase [Planctomycetota bacterium]|nr:imidazolonepropionase [Planctomycetota bacterium]